MCGVVPQGEERGNMAALALLCLLSVLPGSTAILMRSPLEEVSGKHTDVVGDSSVCDICKVH